MPSGVPQDQDEPLQWGRVLMNAETGDMTSSQENHSVSLQWGRVLMNAETEKVRRYARMNTCFNGAAFS